ncbi:MAG: hypothetical protein HY909_25155 [Deltaproteobacteria bacterium]|nr:hypothetical protein [Deltaproteobacteria bacterium]
MAKAFNVEIYNGVINKNVTYYTDPKWNELLGSADVLVFQAIVESTPAAETVTVQYQTSNDGGPLAALWSDVSGFTVTVSPSSATDVPKAAFDRNASSDAMGAQGRGTISCTTNNGVAVRLIACGRIDV